jgi:uncharacterized coiled-coil protein SlyX
MTKERTIALLEKQLTLSAEREKSQPEQIYRQSEQLARLSDQIEHLSIQLTEQTRTIQSLQNALLEKNRDISALSGKNRGLSKLLAGNVSEKITPEPPASPRVSSKKTPTPKERGNNGAKRKDYFSLEEEVIEIWPEDEAFDRSKAHVISHVDSIRYAYLPCRFIKKVYHQYNCLQGETVVCGKAPRAPFMNSRYDASFTAGLMQQRYM